MKISEQIIEVLEYLGEKFGIAIDWSSETVLPVIQTLCGKYIRWEIATSIVWVVIGVILLAIAFTPSEILRHSSIATGALAS